MMNIKSKKEEFALFNRLSDEWWNENGNLRFFTKLEAIE